MMVYALVPMRVPAADETWSKTIVDFLIGYSILLLGGDAYFYLVHRAFHTVSLYRKTHKTHHTWKHPLSFSAYYIASHTHMIQEHFFSIPCLLFLPVPMSAFMFWEYYGVPAAQMQHSGFLLDELRVPFCRFLKLGHIMTAAGLGWSLVLGSQTISDHDHHHEHGTGNFALSYRYLDKIFGTYVPTGNEAVKAKRAGPNALQPLLGV
jgi:sterol desaturase/sphingolipid hydroxylase (fatty acid hydroxylase superfamily)